MATKGLPVAKEKNIYLKCEHPFCLNMVFFQLKVL